MLLDPESLAVDLDRIKLGHYPAGGLRTIRVMSSHFPQIVDLGNLEIIGLGVSAHSIGPKRALRDVAVLDIADLVAGTIKTFKSDCLDRAWEFMGLPDGYPSFAGPAAFLLPFSRGRGGQFCHLRPLFPFR